MGAATEHHFETGGRKIPWVEIDHLGFFAREGRLVIELDDDEVVWTEATPEQALSVQAAWLVARLSSERLRFRPRRAPPAWSPVVLLAIPAAFSLLGLDHGWRGAALASLIGVGHVLLFTALLGPLVWPRWVARRHFARLELGSDGISTWDAAGRRSEWPWSVVRLDEGQLHLGHRRLAPEAMRGEVLLVAAAQRRATVRPPRPTSGDWRWLAFLPTLVAIGAALALGGRSSAVFLAPLTLLVTWLVASPLVLRWLRSRRRCRVHQIASEGGRPAVGPWR